MTTGHRYRRAAALLLMLLVALTYTARTVWPAAKNNSRQQLPQQLTATCTHVVDGDSLYLQGFKPQVRLWGVDAPERNEPGYDAAKATLKALAHGRTLRCERQDIDKYGRLVARCFLVADTSKQTTQPAQSTVELSRALIERGVASEYCWFSKGFYGQCR